MAQKPVFTRLISFFMVILFIFYLNLSVWPVFFNPQESPDFVFGINLAALEEETDFVPGQILIKYKSCASVSARDSLIKKMGFTERRPFYGNLHLEIVQLPPGKGVKEALRELYGKGKIIEYAQPNLLYFTTAAGPPNDPLWGEQWNLHHDEWETHIDILNAWRYTTGSSNVVVGVMDDGIDYNHPDLRDSMWVNLAERHGVAGVDDDGNGYVDDIYGWNFWHNMDDPHYAHAGDNKVFEHFFSDSHGTLCAGVIAAAKNNEIGFAGVAPGVKVMSLKILGSTHHGQTCCIVEAFYYAIDKGVKIINGSWGTYHYDRALKEAIEAFGDAGGLYITAAGNCGIDIDYPIDGGKHFIFPAYYNLDNMITVTGIDYEGKLRFNWGRNIVHLAAPGAGVPSTMPPAPGGLEGAAAVTSYGTGPDPYRAVFWGFSAIALTDPAEQREAMAKALSFFNLPEPTPEEPVHILLVDDDESNDLNFGYADLIDFYRGPLLDLGYRVTVREVPSGADGPGLAEMLNHDAVVWFGGWQRPFYRFLRDTDVDNLTAYLDQGGRLFLAGEDILTGNFESALVRDYLGVELPQNERWLHSPKHAGLTGLHGGIYEEATYGVKFGGYSYYGFYRIISERARAVLSYAAGTYEDAYTIAWGTSFAAPHVAGVAALLRSVRPEATVAEIKDAILSTVTPLESLKGKTVTGGLLHATRALEYLLYPATSVNLSSLTTNQDALSPVFHPHNTLYTGIVGDEVESMALTLEAANPGATIRVNGAVVESGSAATVGLEGGENTITITVSAAAEVLDEAVKEYSKAYTLQVTRADASSAELSALTLSTSSLTPYFQHNKDSYIAAVPNSVTGIAVTATAAYLGATITIHNHAVDSGTPSQAIALEVGSNPIEVVVTSSDLSNEKTYTITVTREGSGDACLNNLSLSHGTLSPAFDPDTLDYTTGVRHQIYEHSSGGQEVYYLTATARHPGAIIKIGGMEVPDGEPVVIRMSGDPQTVISVEVTAENGETKKIYRVTANRLPAWSNANLSGLTLSRGTLDPQFDPDVTGYTVNVGSGVPVITVTPTSHDPLGSVNVDGRWITSGSESQTFYLEPGGTTVIWIVVWAEDGTRKTYSISVIREAPSLIRPLGSLSIGDRVVDYSWAWEHRLGLNYSNDQFQQIETPAAGVTKPVTWVVAGKRHYDGLPAHVTLLSNEVIARHCFDNSTNRGSAFGNNHWGNSGKPNAAHGLRTFLNETFYEAFANRFKSLVLTTLLPNAAWDTGEHYTTEDKVFVLSMIETGYPDFSAYEPGRTLSYFDQPWDIRRFRLHAKLPGLAQVHSGIYSNDRCEYFTRTPTFAAAYPDYTADQLAHYIARVKYDGACDTMAYLQSYGARPALNLKAETAVFLNDDGYYEILGERPAVVYGDLSGDEEVTASDVSLALRYIAGLTHLEPYPVFAADVSGDDRVDMSDAILILRKIVGLLPRFPVD